MDATGSQPARQRGSAGRLWIVLALAAAILAVVVMLASRSTMSTGNKGPAIGRKLLYLQLEGLTGDSKAVSLEDLIGHVTLVNFWGTWCVPCQFEFPHVVELAEKFGSHDDFRIYPVSCGGEARENLEVLRGETEAFLRSRHVSLPTYADQNAASRQAMAVLLDLGDFAYPTTLVLDRRGTIRGFWLGYERGSEREMQSLVEKLLREPAS
jgi:thiol-disulfide isomerase/thioredoxin